MKKVTFNDVVEINYYNTENRSNGIKKKIYNKPDYLTISILMSIAILFVILIVF